MFIDLGILSAVLVAISQLAKLYINNKFIPLVNVVLGILMGAVYIDGPIKESILIGIAIGLMASGLFDITKIVKKDK